MTTEDEAGKPLGRSQLQAQGVRYSLKDMLEEVGAERDHSAMGRELLDAIEIDGMFAGKRRRKRTKK